MNQYQFLISGPVYNEPVETVRNLIGGTIDIVRIIITALCIIALTILAIKYFSESPSIKSEQKSVLPDYMIGIVMFLGITNILPFIVDIISSILSQI